MRRELREKERVQSSTNLIENPLSRVREIRRGVRRFSQIRPMTRTLPLRLIIRIPKDPEKGHIL
jgi:hypothetical protein